jgi:hypothetical protein
MAGEVHDVVHIASLFDESVSTCGATSGLLRVFWDATPREKRCQECMKELLAIAANLQKVTSAFVRDGVADSLPEVKL